MAGDIILSVAYGIRILPESDPYIALSEAGLEAIIKSATWGSYAVDLFPILKYIPPWTPGIKYKKEARKWEKMSTRMVISPFDLVKQRTVSVFALLSKYAMIRSQENAPD